MSVGLVFDAYWGGEIVPRQLTWIAHGGEEPPTVELIDEDQCPPGETYSAMPMLSNDQPQPKGGTWAGSLPVPENADQVRLRLTVGGSARTLICRRHRLEPALPAKPSAKRRVRHAAPVL